MDANELLKEYYPTIDHVELGELYCRDKVIIIMKEYAEKWHETEVNKLKQADVSGMFAFADWCIKETIFTWEEKFPNKYFLINPKAYNTARQYTIEELYEKFDMAVNFR